MWRKMRSESQSLTSEKQYLGLPPTVQNSSKYLGNESCHLAVTSFAAIPSSEQHLTGKFPQLFIASNN